MLSRIERDTRIAMEAGSSARGSAIRRRNNQRPRPANRGDWLHKERATRQLRRRARGRLTAMAVAEAVAPMASWAVTDIVTANINKTKEMSTYHPPRP